MSVASAARRYLLRTAEKPVLWLIAGPNGSGKSTLYNHTDIEGWDGSVWIVNPDQLTSRLCEVESLAIQQANVEALNRIESWLRASIAVHQTVGVETVLSTSKYRPLIEEAKGRGYEIRMLYVVLDTIDVQLERIRIRVSEGGHDVPADKVRTRREKSFEQLSLFCKHLDRLMIFNNSGGSPRLSAYKRYKKPLHIVGSLPPDLKLALVQGCVPLIDESKSP